jgi:hypothetical protein
MEAGHSARSGGRSAIDRLARASRPFDFVREMAVFQCAGGLQPMNERAHSEPFVKGSNWFESFDHYARARWACHRAASAAMSATVGSPRNPLVPATMNAVDHPESAAAGIARPAAAFRFDGPTTVVCGIVEFVIGLVRVAGGMHECCFQEKSGHEVGNVNGRRMFPDADYWA